MDYPLTIENCGQSVTFEEAPQNAVALGQNSAEIMLLLGLEDRMAATAFWPNSVLPEVAEANDQVEVLTVEFPTLESVLSKQPDFVAAMLTTLLGPDSKVAKRSDFEELGIPTYLSPSACATTLDANDAYGSRNDLWSMDLLYKEIEDLSRIFDVADRGQALIEDFKSREAALREQFSETDDLSFLFWFSSPSPARRRLSRGWQRAFRLHRAYSRWLQRHHHRSRLAGGWLGRHHGSRSDRLRRGSGRPQPLGPRHC